MNSKNYTSEVEYIWNLTNERTHCLYCGSKTEFHSFKRGYKNYCDKSCQGKHNAEKISNTLKETHSNQNSDYWANRANKHKETIANASDEYEEQKRIKKSKTTKSVHSARTDEEKAQLNKTLSKAVKESEKAQKQRHERAKLGNKALQELLSNMTTEELQNHYQKQQHSREQHWMKNYGVKNSMQVKHIKNNNREAMRKTMIKLKYWFNDEYAKLFAQYTRRVWSYTNKNDLTLLENFDKRGHINIPGTYHLDHNYSIYQGFKDNIPTWIIGNIVNLQMLPARENITKNKKCYTTKEELLEQFYTNS